MMRCVLLAAAVSVTLAQTPSIRQSLGWKTASSPEISPDARFVTWTVSEADWNDNESKTQLWLWSKDTGTSVQLTRDKRSSSSPRFSPDSNRLAFLSARDGKTQVYVMPLAGGEPAQLTKDEAGVAAFEWSPDGKRIAFTSTGPEPKSLKDRKEKYGDFEVVRGDYRYTHLFLVDVPADIDKPADAAALTSGESFTVREFAWSPGGRAIAFAAARNPDLPQGHTTDIYLVSLDQKTTRKLVEREGAEMNLTWSPDGREIAFVQSSFQPFDCCLNSRIGVVPVGGGPIRNLAADLDENPSLDGWTPAGLDFSAFQKTRLQHYRLNPAAGSYHRILASDTFTVGPASFSRDGRALAFLGLSAGGLPEVYYSALEPLQPAKITEMNAQLQGFRVAPRELVSWKSKDGAVIEGVLVKPPDFDPAKKYPLLVVIHGGPTGIDRPYFQPDRNYPVEVFASKGALVLRPNYRGSAGYGEKFRSLNVRNLGVGDAWDVLSGVDHLIAQGIADPARLGAMGWSQGGYISAFLTTTTAGRFKAISVGAGISDWMTYYVNTDITTFTRSYLKATPWDDPDIYRRTSPISYVKEAKTPTLIQHGELDKRVPIPNAYELRQALEDRGVPVRMVVYKGFGHGITKPKQMLHVMEDNLAWFSKYIWNEESK